MATAGTPLIRPSDRSSDASASPMPALSGGNGVSLGHYVVAPADGSSGAALSDEYQLSDALPNASGWRSSPGGVEFADIGLGHYPSEIAPSVRLGRRGSGSRVVPRIAGIDVDSSLSRAHHPLLSPDSTPRPHPLLSPMGVDVVLDMSEMGYMSAAEKREWIARRWAQAQPEDVFVHSFSFLGPNDLAATSTVSRGWSHVAYEPSLWAVMDLSAQYTRVDDAFLAHLLGSRRFVQLQTLNLEGCSAITNKGAKTVLYCCPNLRELRFTECSHINNPWVFVELVKALPYLRKLELYGCTKEFAIVTPMLTARPKLDLGLFWLEYCAENGIKANGGGLADCRYDEAADNDDPAPARAAAAAGGAGQRGCWGRIKGRPVLANDFYHRGGNYPREVLYSCENHAEQDFADPAYSRCHVCEGLFVADGDSMWTALICRVCFDQENLQNKSTWVALDASSIKEFTLGSLVSKGIHVASRKNLPVSLRSFGSTPARLDYTLPELEEEEKDGGGGGGGRGGADDGEEEEKALVSPRRRIDPTDVPLSVFVSVNGWRLDETVHQIRTKLTAASDALNTRALLVYDNDQHIEVLADKRVILDGKEGEEHMQLTVQAWHQALEILVPVVIVMILVCHFSVLFVKATLLQYDGLSNPTAYIAAPTDTGMSPLLVLIIALIAVIALIVAVFLVYRFREQCERCFKRFLVADILLIFMFGVAMLLWLGVSELRIYLDTLTFVGIIWNLSIIGLMSLYFPMPERLLHFFLILLNSIMSIMLVATLGKWLVLTFLLLLSVADIVSEMKPHMRWLSPFIIPTGVELIYNTPKILYTVGGLRLRAADLMCYGMLTGLAVASGNSRADYATVLLGGSFVFTCVMGGMALWLFVAPFIGSRFRPLPFAVIAAFVTTEMLNDVILPFITAQNNLLTKATVFQ